MTTITRDKIISFARDSGFYDPQHPAGDFATAGGNVIRFAELCIEEYERENYDKLKSDKDGLLEALYRLESIAADKKDAAATKIILLAVSNYGYRKD